MAQLDGKQIRIGTPTDGQYGTNSVTYGLTPSLNLPDALDTLASNINQVAASASITVVDYNTGASVSGVQNIIFRGGKVEVPAGNGYPGGGWTASAVTGTVPTAIVWIPAPPTPTWKPEFSNASSILAAGTNRYISDPTTNGWTTSVIPGYYGIDTWISETDRTVQHPTFRAANMGSNVSPFSYSSNFAVFGSSSSVTFTLHNFDGSTMSTVTATISTTSPAQIVTSSDGFLTLTVGSVSVDDGGLGDAVSLYTPPVRYYCPSLGATANISTLFPNGGRFKFTTQVVYYNESLTIENYNADTNYRFYDNEVTSASVGTVVLDELTPVVRYQSGVAYYTNGAVFGYTVSGINDLNALSQPLTEQMDVTSTSPLGGGAVSNIDGAEITGWVNTWDDTNDTYGKTWSASYGGSAQYPGGFSGSTNLVSETPNASVTANVYDWALVDTQQSNQMLVLVDTTTGTSPTYNTNPIDGETSRVKMSTILSDGTANYVSGGHNTTSLSTNNDELQYVFGRIIYPQQNFNVFNPTTNNTLGRDYSSLSGSSKTFTVYTNINTGSTTTVNFTDHRWYASYFGKDASFSTSFGEAIITFTSNFTESVLDYDKVTPAVGSGDLVILVGHDSTGSNITPDKFFYLSGNVDTAVPSRQQPTTYNLNGGTKQIRFSKGLLASTKKVWVLVGFKNTTTGKSLRLDAISFATV